MHIPTHTLRITLALALAGLAAGCATTEAPVAATAAAPTASAEEEASTGTRLGQPATYHMLRRIGAAGAREMMRDRPPPPGPTAQ